MKMLLTSYFHSIFLLNSFFILSVKSLPSIFRDKIVSDSGELIQINDYRYQNAKPISLAGLESKALTIIQIVDHFDRSNQQTFSQRYFVNTTFWQSEIASSPIFLCVGGEGPPLDESVLISSVHCNDMVELAANTGALMFALEHRYYGSSNPFSDFSTESLRFLNTEQALEDIAEFISQMNTLYNTSTSNKWVTWGGSYPGMVAGLARLRFPNLIHAAVSSSAPLQAAVEMPYFDVVSEDLTNPLVGGSNECLSVVVSAHKEIGTLLDSPEGRRSLESTFNLCKADILEDSNNREMFAGNGVVYIPSQSNDPSCTTSLCNLASVCAFLTSPETSNLTPLDKIANLSKAQGGSSCVSINYDAMVKAYVNPKSSLRLWQYQTCSEWGFYQTCDVGSNCPWVQGLHTVDFDYAICKAAFDITGDMVEKFIASTNARYGGLNIQSSRILFVNGQVDPWKSLSVLESPLNSVEEPTMMVLGASHHFWTHPSLSTDSDDVVNARQAIWKQVIAWLSEA